MDFSSGRTDTKSTIDACYILQKHFDTCMYTHFPSRGVLSTASRFSFHPAEVYNVFVCVREKKTGGIHSKPQLPLA